MSVTTTFGKDAAGRVDFIKLSMRGKSPVEVRYFYTGDAVTVEVKGDKRFLPSIAELIAMIDAKFIGRIDQIALVDLISRIVLIDTIAAITNIANINSVDLIDRITLLDRITLIDTITNIGTLANLTNVGTVNLVNTISTITNIVNIANVQSIDLIDAITNIVNLQSLDLIDRITLIDAITNIGTIGTITTLTGITNPINVKTSGATNIVLDLLTQGAYTERRSIFSNDNGVIAPAAPPSISTGLVYAGKFFPRGCRGFLQGIYVYCKRTGAGTITFSYAPNIGMGAVDSVTITPGANWDWVYIDIRFPWAAGHFWNYSSLFLWMSACSADVSWGYDVGVAPDWHQSADLGLRWFSQNARLFVRALINAETCGDIGPDTINTIALPSTIISKKLVHLTVPAMTEVLDTEQFGSGELILAYFMTLSDDARDALQPKIYCECLPVLPFDASLNEWNIYHVGVGSPSIGFSKWDSVNHIYTMYALTPFPFPWSLKVGFFNNSATQRDGYVSYSYRKIN